MESTLGPDNFKRSAKHIGVPHVIDHHIVMAGDDDFRLHRFDDPGRVKMTQIQKTPLIQTLMMSTRYSAV